MKMKKGLLFPLLCALAVSFLIAGCAGNGKYDDAQTVNVA